jgi:hypothetical protein
MQPRHTFVQPKEPSNGAPLVVYGLRPSRRRALERALELVPAAVWLLGLAGFLVPMLMARNGPHADLLKSAALAWFIVFGLINGLFAFRVLPRRRFHRDRDFKL